MRLWRRKLFRSLLQKTNGNYPRGFQKPDLGKIKGHPSFCKLGCLFAQCSNCGNVVGHGKSPWNNLKGVDFGLLPFLCVIIWCWVLLTNYNNCVILMLEATTGKTASTVPGAEFMAAVLPFLRCGSFVEVEARKRCGWKRLWKSELWKFMLRFV